MGKTNAQLLGNLSDTAGMLQDLHNHYQLGKRKLKHFGIDCVGDKLGKFQHECHSHINKVIRRAMFLGDEDFTYKVSPSIKSPDSLTPILEDLLTKETELVEAMQGYLAQAMDVKDDNTRNLYEHLIKWHEDEWRGSSGKAPIDYLEQKLAQIKSVGEKEFILTKI